MTFGWIASICWNRNGSHVRDLVRLGIAVARRTALDHVGDVDLVARQVHRLDHLRQQLARAADERDPLDVLVGARRLADEHQIGVRIADAEHDLLAPSVCSLQREQSAPISVLTAARASAPALWIARLSDVEAWRSVESRLGTPGRCGLARRSRLPRAIRPTPDTPSSAIEAQMFGDWSPRGSVTRRTGSRLTRHDRAVVRCDRGCSRPARVFSCSGCSTSPSAAMNTAAFVSVSKPASVRETSLATIRSICLRCELLSRARTRVPGLRGEADQHRRAVPPRAAPSSARMSGVADQRHRERTVLLAIFCAGARRLGRVVGDRRRHDDGVRAAALLRHRAAPSRRRCARARVARRRAAPASSGPLTRTTCAPRRDASSAIA